MLTYERDEDGPNSPAARAVEAMGEYLEGRGAVTVDEVRGHLREKQLGARPAWIARALGERFGRVRRMVRGANGTVVKWVARESEAPDVVDLREQAAA